MRNLYLVRHGQVDFPQGIRRCIGWTDLGLDDKGRRQAEDLGIYFQKLKERNITVFTSPLLRARETAKFVAGKWFPVYVEEGLKELYMGEWENVPMSQLKKTLESEPKTGEGRRKGLARIKKAMAHILSGASGDVICVAHAGINSCFLADLLKHPLETSRSLPQPYGGFSCIQVDGTGNMEIKELGVMPKKAPDDRECQDIWNHYHTPAHVRNHCQAVWEEARRIGRQLEEGGQRIDWQLVKSAALLHDVARGESDHPEKGAWILIREGYPKVADVIRCHHDLECPAPTGGEERFPERWLEMAVVYLADKRIREDRVVSLDKRFADSKRRCEQAEDREAALAAHERRYRQAKAIEDLIQKQIDGGEQP